MSIEPEYSILYKFLLNLGAIDKYFSCGRITNTVISKTTCMSFPLVGNPSDLFGIVKKDAGQPA